jgi:hypothetical protein
MGRGRRSCRLAGLDRTLIERSWILGLKWQKLGVDMKVLCMSYLRGEGQGIDEVS